MAEQDYAERVAKGAAWLDSHLPGWAEEIDLDLMDLMDECGCILGQLYGDFWWALFFKQFGREDGKAFAAECGFYARNVANVSLDAEYLALEAEWRKVIDERNTPALT